MLNHPVLITNGSRAKINIWSKDRHNAHLLTTIQKLEVKPVRETQKQHSCHIFCITTIN